MMPRQTTNERDGGVTGGPGGNIRQGGGETEENCPDALTKPSLMLSGQTAKGVDDKNAQVGNLLFSSRGCENNVVTAAAGIYKPKDNFIAKPENNVVAAGLAKVKGDGNIDNESLTNNAIGVSILDLNNMDDSNVNFADITVVQINKSFYEDSPRVKEFNNDNDIVKVTEIDMEVDGSAEKKKGRSFPMTTNERRHRKNMRKAAEKRKYKIPEDPFMAKVDQEYMKKRTYAECVRKKDAIILEVRSEDLDQALEVEDFRLIDRVLLFKYLECKQQSLAQLDESSDDADSEEDNNDEKFFYGVIGGISNGACWLACDNQTTADFVMYEVPRISTNKPFKYQVFTSENKPFRYMRAKIPVEFWGDKKTVEGLFRISNKCLTKKIRDREGVKRRAPHFKVCFGCENYQDDLDEEDPRFYWVQFEVDERVLTKLADQKGRLRLGSNNIMLLGGGMVTLAKEKIASQLKEAINVVTDGSG